MDFQLREPFFTKAIVNISTKAIAVVPNRFSFVSVLCSSCVAEMALYITISLKFFRVFPSCDKFSSYFESPIRRCGVKCAPNLKVSSIYSLK